MPQLFILLISLLSLTAHAQGNGTYRCWIVQDNKKHDIAENSEVRLHKAPFALVVELDSLEGVFVNIAYTADNFDALINEPKHIPSKTMVESNFNENQHLLLDKEHVCFWFYDSTMTWHRFDKDVVVNGNVATGTKTVTGIFEVENDRDVKLKIEDVKQNLYLSFFLLESKPVPMVYEVKKVKIIWL